ncbi:MAG: helix-turn-helix transcriptional regulator [Alphaproteobacteria bacterium]|nr:helix-turn-helix transcriptional regulator [Alphaproteobacteria bacterium]
MHDFPYPSYLRTNRKRWALTQRELGALLGVSAESLSRYEKLLRTPSLEALIGAEFVFGVHARRLFPSLYASVESKIAKHAALLAEAFGSLDDKETLIKRQLLEEIASRIAGEQLHV